MSSDERPKGALDRRRGTSKKRRGGKKRAFKSDLVGHRRQSSETLPPTKSGNETIDLGLELGCGSSLSLPPTDSKCNDDRDTVGGFLSRTAASGGCRQSELLCESKLKSCHYFKTKSNTGIRSRIHSAMIQKHKRGPPAALPKQQKHRWARRDKRIAELKEFQASPKHAVKVSGHRTYFLGNNNVAEHWPEDVKHMSVSQLSIIDTVRGARIDGVCTLLPRKNILSFKTPAVFEHLQDLERLSPSVKTETARGKSKIPFSDTKSKYVYLGSTALQGGPGVVDSLKSMDKGKKKTAWAGISKFFCAVEDFTLPYMESAEVYGRLQAKQMLGYNTFPLPKN